MSLSLAARQFIATGYRAGLALEKLATTQPRQPDVDAAAEKALSEMWWVADGPIMLEATGLLNLLERRRQGHTYAKPLLLSGAQKVREEFQKQVIALAGRREADRVEALLILLYAAHAAGHSTVTTKDLASWLGTEPEEVEEMLQSNALDGWAELARGSSGRIARITFDGRTEADALLHDEPATASRLDSARRQAETPDVVGGCIEELTLTNVFSFGNAPARLQLGALNIFIGANGSGKTNVLDAIELLAATAGDLRGAVVEAGGIGNILFKGERATNARARLSARIRLAGREEPVRHEIALAIGAGQSFEVVDERIENPHPQGRVKPFFFFAREPRGPMLTVRRGSTRRLEPVSMSATASILGEPTHHVGSPELVSLAAFYSAIRPAGAPLLDRHDRRSLRWPSPADARNDRLTRDATNLANVLSRFQARGGAAIAQIARLLGEVLADTRRLGTALAAGGVVELFVEEEGDREVSALRLSDGTLRFLCLLVLLCDPSPPPVLLIEEPELGLHPDAIGVVADLLRDASEKSQLIVTTHSVDLVDRFSDMPEAVQVVEKEEGSTKVHRQDPKRLKKWLEEYSLGSLWRKGEIGGNRW